MDTAIQPRSIVRRVWGDADAILLVFAGSAAEFALNRAVDWLFVTEAVYRDPVGRFFTTASYAQSIAFGDAETASRALAKIRAAHAGVEARRGGGRIPDWAHRDVLYMLVDYSERAFEVLNRPLRSPEQEELWRDFRAIGCGLGIPDLPEGYAAWRRDRREHLARDLAFSTHTAKLYEAYRRDLGAWRFELLLHLQGALVPARVRGLARLPGPWLRPALALYPVLVRTGLHRSLRKALVPSQYLGDVARLDHPEVRDRSRNDECP